MTNKLIFLSLLLATMVACKSSKIHVAQTKQTTKEIENSKLNLVKTKKDKQKNDVDSVSNLKSLKVESGYKNFVDSIENGLHVSYELGSSFKADSVPKILKETFPDAYFYVSQSYFGYSRPTFSALFNTNHYSWNNFNDLLIATPNFKNIPRQSIISAFLCFGHFRDWSRISNITEVKQKIDQVDFEYLVEINDSNRKLLLLVAFTNEGKLFKILNITDNKNILYSRFNIYKQY